MGQNVAIGVDVGGTGIRAALVDEGGNIHGEIHSIEMHAHMGQGTFLTNLIQLLHAVWNKKSASTILGIGFGMPGPFDYERGISQMRGVAKYDSLYGIDLLSELRTRLKLSRNLPIRFINDAAAFALGEWYFGKVKAYGRVLALTLGTGCGSAFLVDGKVSSPKEGVGSSGYVFDLPYQKSIVDDYISSRGILGLWAKITTEHQLALDPTIDVEGLAAKADGGSELAQKLFSCWGAMIVEALHEPITTFKPECIVLGGSISKSAHLFISPIMKELKHVSPQTELIVADNLKNSGIRGAAQIILCNGADY